jgi:hypothetical protein
MLQNFLTGKVAFTLASLDAFSSGDNGISSDMDKLALTPWML